MYLKTSLYLPHQTKRLVWVTLIKMENFKTFNENTTLENFNAWSGAVETKNTIIEKGFSKEFDNLICELYPDGLTETQLNDILWFEEDWIFETLGISTEEEEE